MRNRQGTHRVVLGALVAAMTAAAPPRTAVTQAPLQTPADLVIVNANVVTLDDTRPRAQALAARAGRIVALGTDAEVRAHAGPATEVIDAAGQLVIPGFIEGHAHFTGIGTLAMSLNLMHARSWDEIVAMVAERVKTAKPGEWIIGRGWHQEKWSARPMNSTGTCHRLLMRLGGAGNDTSRPLIDASACPWESTIVEPR